MPLEQISNALTFYGFYVASKQGATGLTVTVDVWRINAFASPTQIVTADAATAVGGGLYLYQLASGSVTVEGEYVCIFKTTDTTVDVRHIPAIWVVSKAGTEYLDAAVSTRLPTSSYTAPSSITSLQADVTTILGRTDVATSTRLATSAYTAPSSITGLQADVTTILGRVDVATSTRLGTGGGSTSYVVTITRPDGTTPISGASVWVTTDSAGGNVIAGTLTTNGSGVATFMLDAGSYYLWRQAEGWNFSNPTAITVT